MDLEPPYPLALLARKHWDRISKQIYAAGRWPVVSADLLAQFCQTLALSQDLLAGILADGVLVAGSRQQDRVRHPLMTPWTQTQTMLVKLARAIPLVDPKAVDRDGAATDHLIDVMMKDWV